MTYHDIVLALRDLDLRQDSHVIAHVSLEALGDVRGGAESVLGALLATCSTVVMPAFTYQTMVWPESGPSENGCTYRNHAEENVRAVLFSPDLPVDPSLGPVSQALCRHRRAVRSGHPVLSFAAEGAHAPEIVSAQSLENPLGPLEWLYKHGGDVLLMGMDHRANTAIHLGEKLAGRKQFIRWAVGAERAYRLPGFPGCSNGFNAIAGKLAWVVQQTTSGEAVIQRIPVKSVVEAAMQMIQDDPYALLCDDSTCERCNVIRGISSV